MKTVNFAPGVFLLAWSAWALIRGRVPDRNSEGAVGRRKHPLAFWTMLVVMVGFGLPRQLARMGFVLGVIAYGLWLHIFLARHGLGLTLSRAVAMVLGVNLATVVLVLGPRMLALAASGSPLVDR